MISFFLFHKNECYLKPLLHGSHGGNLFKHRDLFKAATRDLLENFDGIGKEFIHGNDLFVKAIAVGANRPGLLENNSESSRRVSASVDFDKVGKVTPARTGYRAVIKKNTKADHGVARDRGHVVEKSLASALVSDHRDASGFKRRSWFSLNDGGPCSPAYDTGNAKSGFVRGLVDTEHALVLIEN